MFTAIQARNIAQERYNHDYYRLYTQYTRVIMRDIAKYAARGHMEYTYQINNAYRMNVQVLRQIGDELRQYGYNSDVQTYKDEQGKHTAEIRVSWAES